MAMFLIGLIVGATGAAVFFSREDLEKNLKDTLREYVEETPSTKPPTS